ncbi:hypothetical protein FOA52_009877 [Chlamydomonas sp. UWO 241]|nr:hypothetical protein FOA52_009877 [Chlamydomonas sp. UWO 241]
MGAYVALPNNVERADFFRYMVVLRYGGVYADVDVECRQPMAHVLKPTDTMVTGWEAEAGSDEEAASKSFVRKRQILQWFFAAAPGHPALREVCDRIAANAHSLLSEDPNVDTLERTGPGVWTDVVLTYALKHPPAFAGVAGRTP